MRWRNRAKVGWISSLRGARAAKKLIRKSEKQVAELQPMVDLELSIATASWQCTHELKSCISTLPLTKYQEMSTQDEFLIFLEFLFFFLHFVSRQAYGRLPGVRANNLRNTTGPSIITSVIDASIGHWPAETKFKVERELYENLNHAEQQYATCKELKEAMLPTGRIRTQLDEDALLSVLAFHVLSKIQKGIESSQIDAETAILADMVEISVTSKLIDGKGAPKSPIPDMSFGTLNALGLFVDKAGAALEAYERDGRSLREARREVRELLTHSMVGPADTARPNAAPQPLE